MIQFYDDGDTTVQSKSLVLHLDENDGIKDVTIINGQLYKGTFTISDSKLSLVGRFRYFGINNIDMLDSMVNTSSSVFDISNNIIVYDLDHDSLLYSHAYSNEDWKYLEAKSYVKGDYIYYAHSANIYEDLLFMGDSLPFQYDELGNRAPNYLHKINYKTGEKVWTHNIGSGEIAQLMVDHDENIYVDVLYSNFVTYDLEVVRYDNHYGDDRVVLKISTEGEYIDHVHIANGPVFTVGRVFFNEDGSFQVMGAVSYPTHVWIDDTDSLDFTHIEYIPFPNTIFEGYLLTFDSELNLESNTILQGGQKRLPYSINKMRDGSYIASTECQGTSVIEINGVPYGEEIDFQYSSLGCYIYRLSEEGNLNGTPRHVGPAVRIYDLEEIAENNYVLLIDVFHVQDNYAFADLDVASEDVDMSIIHYQGDIHDINTAIADHFSIHTVSIYPNPIAAGSSLQVDLEDLSVDHISITLTSLDGANYKIDKYNKVSNTKYEINISSDIIPSTYILQVFDGDRVVSSKKVIVY